jgi:hypothetical protein
MLQSLQVQQTPSNVVTSAVVQPSVPYQSVPYQSVPYQSVPYQTVKSREQQLTDQFTRRQAEYESMVKKDVPTPHFTENVKDEAILDLGSAVKEYMKQRDQDIEIPKPADSPTNASLTPLQSAPASLTPLQSAPASLTPLQSAPASLTPLKLNLNNAEPISLTVEELPTKKVQWGENTEHVFDRNESIILVRMEKEILEMKTKLEEILALLQK